jgi:DNA-binding NarL/FixJ family response regulator
VLILEIIVDFLCTKVLALSLVYTILDTLKNNVVAINERRQKVLTLLTGGMKVYDVAKELGTALHI